LDGFGLVSQKHRQGVRQQVNVFQAIELPSGIHDLACLARDSGHHHLDRLITEFETGANRFDKPGEALFAVHDDTQSLVGVGGINIDPYDALSVGRVRRLYVHSHHQRSGIGSLLMRTIEAHASKHFSVLQLFTSSPAADAFYSSLGYDQVRDRTKVSHAKRLSAS
jgi:GNAT superfamily N-acetyltransferase